MPAWLVAVAHTCRVPGPAGSQVPYPWFGPAAGVTPAMSGRGEAAGTVEAGAPSTVTVTEMGDAVAGSTAQPPTKSEVPFQVATSSEPKGGEAGTATVVQPI